MTRGEFSEQFDFWYNNLTSYQAPGLMEDEKSMVLTKAQDEVLLNHFTGNNPLSQGFDASAKRQADFSDMIRTYEEEKAFHAPTEPYASTYEGKWNIERPTEPNIYIIVNEEVTVYNSYEIVEVESITKEVYGDEHVCTVVPLSASEYARVIQKPYKYPPKDQAWRLYTTFWKELPDPQGGTRKVETAVNRIIGWWPEAKKLMYTIRYIKKPEPIDLTTGSEDDECCELPEILHDEIIQRAVELAKAAWQGDVNTTIETGKRSE